MPSVKPKVATCEDYDSDTSAVKSGSRVKAERRVTMAGPPVSMDRHRSKHRQANSDSGYSSHTTGSKDSKASADAKAMPPPPRPPPAQTSAKSKPVLVQRTSSQRNSQSAPQRSPTKSTQPGPCSDPQCGDPKCAAALAQKSSRRNSTQYPVQYQPQYAPSPGGQQQPQYQYTYQQLPQSSYTQTVPTLANPSPRRGSSSQQSRPTSFHGGYTYPPSTQGGPPPSASAYHSQVYNYNAAMQQQALQGGGFYGSTPPNQMYSSYMQGSPVRQSPIATSAAAGQGLQRTTSARSINTHPAAGAVGRPQSQTIQSARMNPARQLPAQSKMPGAWSSSESESESESDSDSEYSEEEYEQQRRRARDSRLMSSSSQRRPSIKERTVTDSAMYTNHPSRDVLIRNHRRDHVLEDILSSDNMDSDRTTRAIAGRSSRTNYSNSSKSSRRPSVSTTASSGRTKTTAPSSLTGSQVVVEDSKGRRVSYLSQRDRESIVRQLQAQKLDEQHRQRQDEVEAYQNKVRGSRQPELTADNIRKQQHRSSGSHVSHERRSSRSSSKAAGEGFRVDYGSTTLHVYGDTTLELHAGEDGGPGRMVIGGGGASGKDSTYHSGSKSSSSRMGRSRGGSDRGSRRRERSSIPEDGYEPAL